MTPGCPSCGAAAPEGGQFCEVCGTDLDSTDLPRPGPAEPKAGTAWEVTATADLGYFQRVEADGVDFPVAGFDRCFNLEKDRATIGRRSASRGVYPDIDLSGPPTDNGVSHLHAVLVRGPDGTWAIVDPGSTNGTFLNDSPDAIPTDALIPVADGDRIHIGAWTTLTLHSTSADPKGGG
jgi:hypothetical protein